MRRSTFFLLGRLHYCLLSILITLWITGCGVDSKSASSMISDVTPTSNFTLTGNMKSARFNQTATLLTNGQVLVVGGLTSKQNTSLTTAEIFDPTSATFTPTGSLNSGRAGHTATLLNNGQVLIAGGESQGAVIAPLATAELYDPGTDTFSYTGSMTVARVLHTATLLNNGLVLIVGGINPNGVNESSAELYNPATGTFATTIGHPIAARERAPATLLGNGSVLIAGGFTSPEEMSAFTSAELYDYSNGTFSSMGNMSAARAAQTATLLDDGTVLVAGGYYSQTSTVSADIFSPSSGAFAPTGSMITDRGGHAAALLNSGMVLVAGGATPDNSALLASAEFYNPATGTFSHAGTLNVARFGPTASLLESGIVLLTGGSTISSPVVGLPSAELYQPASPTLVSISLSPANPIINIGASQKITATGKFSDGTTEILVSVIWSSSNPGVSVVSDDATNQGTAYGVAVGSAAITATVGPVTNSTTITVN